jgi:hypothetical protein
LNDPFISISPTGQKGHILKCGIFEKVSEKFSLKEKNDEVFTLVASFLKNIDNNWIFSVVKQQNAEGGN